MPGLIPAGTDGRNPAPACARKRRKAERELLNKDKDKKTGAESRSLSAGKQKEHTYRNSSLSATQRKAAEHRDGPMMVLAGPGSGKTTVVTHRVLTLIWKYHADPASILVITFTKAAAREMRDRFFRLAGEKLPVTFGTFHAVFFTILKQAYGYHSSDIVSGEERHQFMKQAVARMHLETEGTEDLISSVYAEISAVKNSGIDLENYYAACCGQDTFRALYRAYQKFLRDSRKIDFDDMLVYCRELLTKRKDILAGWQKRYHWILVDEFQDINQIQYEIVRMLASRSRNLFLVGDDDQSIYRFRGAKPEIMMHVKDDFPDLETLNLPVNYRCPVKVVELAGRLISHNEVRIQKEIKAGSGTEGAVQNLCFSDQAEENEYLARRIREEHEAGLPYRETAVLFRTNRQPAFLAEILMRYNIPFRTKEKIPDLYDHWIAKDLFCYIRVAKGSRRRSDLLRIMNRPNRYLSRESLPSETVDFGEWERWYADMDWVQKRLRKFFNDLDMISRMRPYSAVNYIRKAVGYEGYLKETAEKRQIEYEELEEVLDELQSAAKPFATFEEWTAHVNLMREELKKQGERGAEEKDAVMLSTLHGAKGLEYAHVYIPDLNEGYLPYRKSVLDSGIEEERRLLYVGMTRAKEELTLSSCGKIHSREALPSRFLDEIFGPEEEEP